MLDKLTKDFISKLVIEINKEENKTKLEQEVINQYLPILQIEFIHTYLYYLLCIH